jgi:hypothetical protein
MRFPKRNRIDNKRELNIKNNYKQINDNLKPNGLWYSCYSSWYNWISGEMPQWLYKYIHKINFNKNVLTDLEHKDKDKVLVLKNIRDINLFHKQYSYKRSSKYINWTKVTEDYGGIEMCPYFPELRKKYPWYYSLDAASGCVWNTKNIIKDYELIYEKKKGEYIKFA